MGQRFDWHSISFGERCGFGSGDKCGAAGGQACLFASVRGTGAAAG